MAFGKQTARRIGDAAPAVSVVAIPYELLSAALRAKAKRFIRDQFVRREPIMQLRNLHLAWPDACLLVALPRRLLGHLIAGVPPHRSGLRSVRCVGTPRLRANLGGRIGPV